MGQGRILVFFARHRGTVRRGGVVGEWGLGRRRPWSARAGQIELGGGRLVYQWLRGVAPSGERLTRLSAEVADVKRIVVVVVYPQYTLTKINMC